MDNEKVYSVFILIANVETYFWVFEQAGEKLKKSLKPVIVFDMQRKKNFLQQIQSASSLLETQLRKRKSKIKATHGSWQL